MNAHLNMKLIYYHKLKHLSVVFIQSYTLSEFDMRLI